MNLKFFKNLTITNSLILINISIFIIFFIVDPTMSSLNAIKFGAKVKYAMADLELFRLISANFLHLSLTHIAFNSFALYLLGNQAEAILGKLKFSILYFGSGVISIMGSTIFSNSVSAGASGALFGIMGLHLFLYLENKNRYLAYFGKDFLVLIFINIAFGLFVPNIDMYAHLFGLISGIFILLLIYKKNRLSNPLNKAISITLLLAIVGVFFISIYKYKEDIDYYIFKSTFALYDNKSEIAYETIINGLEKFPNDEILNEYLTYFEAN
jgi:rhomboid protease GluP